MSQGPVAAARVPKAGVPAETPSASEPLDVDLLAHVDGGIIVSELAKGIGVGRGQRDAVVDVEDLGRPALGLDVVGRGDHVLLGVDLAVRPDAAAGDRGLRGAGLGGVRAEVVLAEEGAGDPGLELGVPVVGAVDDCEGVAGWVAERQVDLLFVSSVTCQWYKMYSECDCCHFPWLSVDISAFSHNAEVFFC